MSGKLYVVVGGQYGSEGKGAVAGRLALDLARSAHSPVVGVRVGGPNAGHTVLGNCPEGCEGGHDQPARKVEERPGPDAVWTVSTPQTPLATDAHPWRLRTVPVSAVTAPESALVIAAGSEIDPVVLNDELDQLDSAGYDATRRLLIDRSATVIERTHAQLEQARGLTGRIGSTGKGIGAARSDRIWRTARTWGQFDGADFNPWRRGLERPADTATVLAGMLYNEASVVVEGTQGYGLGLHTDSYPQVTSGDCRAIDFLAAAGLSPWQHGVDLKILVCLRPYPIRVAGNSGPMHGETTWHDLGLPVEYTTVTQKVRRVGHWDPNLARAAMAANGGASRGVVYAALTMMDSVDPELSGLNGSKFAASQSTTPKSANDLLASFGWNAGHLAYIGTGPDTAIVNEGIYF